MSVETFKPALAAWLAYRELGDINQVWHDSHVDAPEWVDALMYVYAGDGELAELVDMDSELYQEFEKLMVKHQVWFEISYGFLWIYRSDKFDHLTVEQDPRFIVF